MILELRKYNLVKFILGLNNELIVSKIEQLMKEQNYKHPTKEELDNIIKEANIKEPIEELLKMI